ncbi:protein FAM149B1-like isoform X1 [Chiloscyllium plagiosum]|uniref:protein FAM149B1-like isoform X1 n=1 Tax=Chiloscyllium plagiosum TaxID=36176 RepID=UPI001CB810A4|nr:protein FAM149B1-like isoform X1 [Chiloscyllium plagiosum]
MIQRYSRRLLSTPPEIQNLLHHSVENHPLPDKLEEFSTPSPITSVEDVDSTCSCESEISDDTSNQPSQDDFGHHWSAANSYTGTRISTACSSTFSWGDNEFENTTSQQVQQMLCEIDELLFEDKTCSHVQKLEKECQEWKWRFPHFRILGKQIVPPADEAYCWYPGPENVATPLPTFSSSSEGDVTELCVLGKKVTISDLSQCKDGDFMQKIATFPGEEHEEAENGVIIAEGIVEEYLVVDRRELEDENYEKKLAPTLQSESRLGLPLVSPSHCRRNIIVAELFNEVWLEFLGCMEELIRKHWEGHISDEEKSTASDESAGIEQTNLFLPLEPQLSQVRVPALTSYLTKSQRFDSTEWLAMQLQKTFKSQPRWCGSGVTYRTDEVQQAYSGAVQSRPSSLQIQGIPFHQPSPSLSGKIQTQNTAISSGNFWMDCTMDQDERPVLRPRSSIISSNHFRANHLLEPSVSSLSYPVPSARRRNPPRTLHPIHSSLCHSGTPTGSIDEVVQGIRLQTASDRLSASTLPLRHNALLPPIGSIDIDHSAGKLTARPQKIRMYSNRAHSAVIDETSHLPPKDRLLGHEYFTRPKTSHTFRSDISYHRSFTALEYAHHAHTDRRFAGPDSNSTGVTELNLNSSSSSHLEMLQHHSHSGSLIEAEEKVEEQTSLGHHLPLPIPPLIRGGIGSRSRTAL